MQPGTVPAGWHNVDAVGLGGRGAGAPCATHPTSTTFRSTATRRVNGAPRRYRHSCSSHRVGRFSSNGSRHSCSKCRPSVLRQAQHQHRYLRQCHWVAASLLLVLLPLSPTLAHPSIMKWERQTTANQVTPTDRRMMKHSVSSLPGCSCWQTSSLRGMSRENSLLQLRKGSSEGVRNVNLLLAKVTIAGPTLWTFVEAHRGMYHFGGVEEHHLDKTRTIGELRRANPHGLQSYSAPTRGVGKGGTAGGTAAMSGDGHKVTTLDAVPGHARELPDEPPFRDLAPVFFRCGSVETALIMVCLMERDKLGDRNGPENAGLAATVRQLSNPWFIAGQCTADSGVFAWSAWLRCVGRVVETPHCAAHSGTAKTGNLIAFAGMRPDLAPLVRSFEMVLEKPWQPYAGTHHCGIALAANIPVHRRHPLIPFELPALPKDERPLFIAPRPHCTWQACFRAAAMAAPKGRNTGPLQLEMQGARRDFLSAAVLVSHGYRIKVQGMPPTGMRRNCPAPAKSMAMSQGWCTYTVLAIAAGRADPGIRFLLDIVKQYIATWAALLEHRQGVIFAWAGNSERLCRTPSNWQWYSIQWPWRATLAVVHATGTFTPQPKSWTDHDQSQWSFPDEYIVPPALPQRSSRHVRPDQWQRASRQLLAGDSDSCEELRKRVMRALRRSHKPCEAHLARCIACGDLGTGACTKAAGLPRDDLCRPYGGLDDDAHGQLEGCPISMAARRPKVVSARPALHGSAVDVTMRAEERRALSATGTSCYGDVVVHDLRHLADSRLHFELAQELALSKSAQIVTRHGTGHIRSDILSFFSTPKPLARAAEGVAASRGVCTMHQVVGYMFPGLVKMGNLTIFPNGTRWSSWTAPVRCAQRSSCPFPLLCTLQVVYIVGAMEPGNLCVHRLWTGLGLQANTAAALVSVMKQRVAQFGIRTLMPYPRVHRQSVGHRLISMMYGVSVTWVFLQAAARISSAGHSRGSTWYQQSPASSFLNGYHDCAQLHVRPHHLLGHPSHFGKLREVPVRGGTIGAHPEGFRGGSLRCFAALNGIYQRDHALAVYAWHMQEHGFGTGCNLLLTWVLCDVFFRADL